MLQNFADGIWICNTKLSFFGVELGARMTVVDLNGQGSLLVHSPIRLTCDVRSQLASLGIVNYVVAPNKWHHLFLADLKSSYPQAKYYCAPGLQKKRADFTFDGIIGSDQDLPWNPQLRHIVIKGAPIYNEVVFYDPKTRTLILTDLALHICESKSVYTKIALTALGSYKKFGWSSLEKLIYIRDRSAFAKSIQEILTLDFDRVLLAHGEPITTGGKEFFRKAFC